MSDLVESTDQRIQKSSLTLFSKHQIANSTAIDGDIPTLRLI